MNCELFAIGCGIAIGAVMFSCPVWLPVYHNWRYKQEIKKINKVK